ncbi:Denitrification regulatory protein NirQ [bacterium HR30]|nr:Denitrification regulatory protein NirQ [bacterium HR30]
MHPPYPELESQLTRAAYLAPPGLVTVLRLALTLGKPLLVEGPAGAGKTEIARALSEALGRPLLRLQCYEGLDESKALYEWNYHKQLLRLQADGGRNGSWHEAQQEIFSAEYLLDRPLLKALRSSPPAVLLIDEIDKAEEEFEAFLLEFLAEFQVSIPELGTIRAQQPPTVILTSNRSRELSDALRRRCLYFFLDFPTREQEEAIVRLKVPQLEAKLGAHIVRFVQSARRLPLRKLPSVAETIAWAEALVALGVKELNDPHAKASITALIKHEEDLSLVQQRWTSLLNSSGR